MSTNNYTIDLPEELQAAIAQALASTPPARWIRAAQELSERYRATREPDAAPLAAKPLETLGYAAMILPATYAQLWGAMAATAMRIPGWLPRTMLDIGSGPGTALWAAASHWPSLQSMRAWERERAFIELGRRLAQASPVAAVRAAHWIQKDLRRGHGGDEQYDLVVLGHVLNELPADDQRSVVDMAWKLTSGVLLIVEPGTSAAFPIVRTCRDRLLSIGAHTLAPCPHDLPCPLVDDWCHFPQRIMRPPFQRRARAAPSQWEDSKFSYAAMARFPVPEPIWGRVIREPTANKAYAETKISSRAGTSRYRAWKRYRDAYRLVRELRWGSALAEPLPDPIEAIDVESPQE